MYIPEEFVIIGAALSLIGGQVSLKQKVHVKEVCDYMKKLKVPIEYYEDDYKYCELEGEYWVIKRQPDFDPRILSFLLKGAI